MICLTCDNGFNLINGSCFDNSGYCNKVGSNGVCIICNSGYKLIGYQCLPDNVTSPNCFIYDITGTCYICKAGYDIYKGSCLLPSLIAILVAEFGHQNSTTYGSSGNTSNIYNSSSNGGSTYIYTPPTNTTTPSIPNCALVDTTNSSNCITCNTGFYPLSGGCSQISIFCNTYNASNGLC